MSVRGEGECEGEWSTDNVKHTCEQHGNRATCSHINNSDKRCKLLTAAYLLCKTAQQVT